MSINIFICTTERINSYDSYKDAFDKLLEIGEDKQEHKVKTKTASKAEKEYQEHFVYEGGIEK